MFDAATVLIVLATFLLAGTVKGVIGLGLPTVSLALLTVAIDLPSAMALLLVPSFLTNLWQALVGGHLKATPARIWPFLALATATVWLGALALTRVDLALLPALLGALLMAYALASLAGLRLAVPVGGEIWSPEVGRPLSGLNLPHNDNGAYLRAASVMSLGWGATGDGAGTVAGALTQAATCCHRYAIVDWIG